MLLHSLGTTKKKATHAEKEARVLRKMMKNYEKIKKDDEHASTLQAPD